VNINVTLFAQMLVFLGLIWFSAKFIWPPVTKALEERRKKIADGLAAAERGSKSLQDASVKSEAELKAARVQAQEIVGAANKQAGQIVEKAKADAETEKARIVASGRDEAAREITQARDALRKQVGELAVAGASKILKREIDAKAHADVIADLAAQV
jgi:F-type H+-transporting ATPase subunit b